MSGSEKVLPLSVKEIFPSLVIYNKIHTTYHVFWTIKNTQILDSIFQEKSVSYALKNTVIYECSA
jgi:hypothetical protein